MTISCCLNIGILYPYLGKSCEYMSVLTGATVKCMATSILPPATEGVGEELMAGSAYTVTYRMITM
jgi:hypothetical protein